jgi:hypothetical protein
MRLEEKTALEELKRVLQEREKEPLAESLLYKRISAKATPV